jgi:hypothetical protein
VFFKPLPQTYLLAMPYKQKQQTERNIFQQQQHHTLGKTPHGGVGQDKNAPERVRGAIRQAVTDSFSPQTHTTNTKTEAPRPASSRRRKLTYIMLWVEPVVKDELARKAKQNGLSLSATGGQLLKRGLQESIDMQYGAFLEPIIRQEIRRQMHSFSSRIALLLVRVAFAAEQTRSLVTNVLARQPGVKPEILDTLLDSSANAAKSKITAKTPQLERILTEVENWFTEKFKTKEAEG